MKKVLLLPSPALPDRRLDSRLWLEVAAHLLALWSLAGSWIMSVTLLSIVLFTDDTINCKDVTQGLALFVFVLPYVVQVVAAILLWRGMDRRRTRLMRPWLNTTPVLAVLKTLYHPLFHVPCVEQMVFIMRQDLQPDWRLNPLQPAWLWTAGSLLLDLAGYMAVSRLYRYFRSIDAQYERKELLQVVTLDANSEG